MPWPLRDHVSSVGLGAHVVVARFVLEELFAARVEVEVAGVEYGWVRQVGQGTALVSVAKVERNAVADGINEFLDSFRCTTHECGEGQVFDLALTELCSRG